MLEIVTSPTETTVAVAGDLDLAERDQFPGIAARVTGLRRRVLVIDMCGVTFMDSTGAAFLISLADATRKRGGATVLRGCHDKELFVLEVCGALNMFDVDTDHTCTPTPQRAPARGPGRASVSGPSSRTTRA